MRTRPVNTRDGRTEGKAQRSGSREQRPGSREQRPGSRDDSRRSMARSGRPERPERPERSDRPKNSDPENQLEGRNPVREALRAGRAFERILVASGERRGPLGQIVALAKEKGVRVEEVDREMLEKRAVTGAHQGVVAYVAQRPYIEVPEMLAAAQSRNEAPLLLLCDGLQDPHNLGSLLRSTDAAGGHGVIIPSRRSVGLTATVAKTSAGAVEYVPVARIGNLVQEIEALKAAGVWVVGAHMSGGKAPWEIDMTVPTAIVVGGEGEGLSRLVAEKCDYLASIPMAGRINSLNASVAGALLLFEAARQRHLAQA